MQYWHIRVACHRGGECNVFYKTPIKLLTMNVLRHAVDDGDLLDVSASCADIVEEISAEKYYEHMYE
jgi:hypothetical protein